MLCTRLDPQVMEQRKKQSVVVVVDINGDDYLN